METEFKYEFHITDNINSQNYLQEKSFSKKGNAFSKLFIHLIL